MAKIGLRPQRSHHQPVRSATGIITVCRENHGSDLLVASAKVLYIEGDQRHDRGVCQVE